MNSELDYSCCEKNAAVDSVSQSQANTKLVDLNEQNNKCGDNNDETEQTSPHTDDEEYWDVSEDEIVTEHIELVTPAGILWPTAASGDANDESNESNGLNKLIQRQKEYV